MTGTPEHYQAVRQWIERAEQDLKSAAFLLKMGEGGAPENVCFLAQQSVEKYLKALMILKGIPAPKEHNIGRLMAFLPKVFRPRMAPREQERLSDYAVVVRYPGDDSRVPLSEAHQTVSLARRVRMACRKKIIAVAPDVLKN
jgi:HEPN domain-containing protein